jgi:threonine/homoserine/homoserine lactone efflux protein
MSELSTAPLVVFCLIATVTPGPNNMINLTQGMPSLGFWAGIGFQWVNPKTWATSMAMATAYLPANPSFKLALIAAGTSCTIAWLAQPLWIGFGGALRGLLSDPRKSEMINLGLAVLLLASTLPSLLSHN